MCDTWTDKQWLDAANDPDTEYTLATTRYNSKGEVARTYVEDDGWYWAVLPGRGNYTRYIPSVSADYGTTAEAAAIACLERSGYTLQSMPSESETAVAATV